MSDQIKKYSYHIPKTYYHPAMYALKLYKGTDMGFNRAVDIAYASYTSDPSAKHYVDPSRLSRNNLAKHILKYISNT